MDITRELSRSLPLGAPVNPQPAFAARSSNLSAGPTVAPKLSAETSDVFFGAHRSEQLADAQTASGRPAGLRFGSWWKSEPPRDERPSVTSEAGAISLRDNEARGYVQSDADVSAVRCPELTDVVSLGGNVELDDSQATSVTAELGEARLTNQSLVSGNVKAGTVNLASASTVQGETQGSNVVGLYQDSTAKDKVQAGSTLEVHDSTILGPASVLMGDATIDNGRLEMGLKTLGRTDVKKNSLINGPVEASGAFDGQDSTLTGKLEGGMAPIKLTRMKTAAVSGKDLLEAIDCPEVGDLQTTGSRLRVVGTTVKGLQVLAPNGTLEFLNSQGANAELRARDGLTAKHDNLYQINTVRSMRCDAGDIDASGMFVDGPVDAPNGDIRFVLGRAKVRIAAKGDLVAKHGAEFPPLQSGGDMETENVRVHGNLNSGSHAALTFTDIVKDCDVAGNLTMDFDSEVAGATRVGGNATLKRRTTLNGDVTVGGSLSVEPGDSVAGTQYQADGYEPNEVKGKSSIAGRLEVGKDAKLAYITVDGPVNVKGNLSVDQESVLSGDITTTGRQTDIKGKSKLTGANLTLSSERLNIQDAQIGSAAAPTTITVKAPAGADANQSQEVVIGPDAVVNANIVFENGKGKMTVDPAAQFNGEITGGERTAQA